MQSLRVMFDACSRFLFGARAERRFAQHASAQLLELYRRQRREHPEMSKRALYQSIVTRHLGAQAVGADALVRRARQGTKTNMGAVVAQVIPEEF